MRCHPYRRLETWEWETAHVVFDAAELKLPLLGYMVENTVLQQALDFFDSGAHCLASSNFFTAVI